MSSCVVPPELVDQILDNLYDSPDTIKQCSLVCRSWLPTCRLHIHRRLYLESPTRAEDEEAFQTYCRFLEESPHLAPYVRECVIRGTEAGAIMKGGTMRNIFKMLSKLRKLELERLDWVNYHRELEDIPILLSSPFISSMSLRYCRFNTYSDFLPLVGNNRALRKLQFIQCDMHDRASSYLLDAQDIPQQRTYLRHLHLEGSEQSFITDWLLHPLSTVSIERLPVLYVSTPIDANFVVASQLLEAVGPSLEYFNFDFSGSMARDYDALRIIHNPNLRKLHLRGGSGRSAMFAGNTAVWSQAMMGTIAADNSLEEISVCMRMDFIPLRGTHTSRWVEIEALLLQPHFRCLRRVHIHIITSMNIEANPIIGFVATEMEQMMSTLYERGVLDVQMESDFGVKEPEPIIMDWA